MMFLSLILGHFAGLRHICSGLARSDVPDLADKLLVLVYHLLGLAFNLHDLLNKESREGILSQLFLERLFVL